ncbi:hypothetical protein PPMP20_15485 [Paraburkholderia phymatum]|nr:hypothetical protein [Paraburkholderia phymatum]
MVRNRKGLGRRCNRPQVMLDVRADIMAEAGQANVDAERPALQDKADKWRWYPLVKAGVAYRF